MIRLTKLRRVSLALILALVALILAWTPLVRAGNPGDLDTSFGGTGIVTTSITSNTDGGFSTIIQPDGKMVVAGFSDSGVGSSGDFTVVRYNSNGALDTTFNNTGIVTTAIGSGGSGFSVASQADGKLVVAGNSGVEIAPGIFDYSFALARYTITGSLDTDFNGTGVVTTSLGDATEVGQTVALQPDGKIVVGGYFEDVSAAPLLSNTIALVRYTITGSLDTTFNDTGIVTTFMGSSARLGYDRSLAIQPDGKIIAAGSSDAGFITRYTITGSLDTSFNHTGIVTIPGMLANSVALQPNGKIVAAGGSSSGDFMVARYNDDGALDATFNGTGIVTTSIQGNADGGLSVTLQPDGKIVVAGVGGNFDNITGQVKDIAVARYNSDGSLDTTFNDTGIVTTTIGDCRDDEGWSVAIQPDSKIVVAGFTCDSVDYNFVVVRYLGRYSTYLPLILKDEAVQ